MSRRFSITASFHGRAARCTLPSTPEPGETAGYDVLRRLRSSGLEGVGDSSVYGTLRRLYASGALTSYVVPSDEGPHRKYYGITTAGRALLERQREDWGRFSTTVTRLLDRQGAQR